MVFLKNHLYLYVLAGNRNCIIVLENNPRRFPKMRFVSTHRQMLALACTWLLNYNKTKNLHYDSFSINCLLYAYRKKNHKAKLSSKLYCYIMPFIILLNFPIKMRQYFVIVWCFITKWNSLGYFSLHLHVNLLMNIWVKYMVEGSEGA